jgi:hypothetical protein
LGSLTGVANLIVYFIQAVQRRAPVGITPFFLPDLKFVTTFLSVAECIEEDEFGLCIDLTPPFRSRLAGLPGLQGLARAGTRFQILNTAFPDMKSLSGVTCPVRGISILNNTKLTALSGLEGLPTWTLDSAGPKITITSNPVLESAQAITEGVCQGPRSSLTGNVLINTTTCTFEVCPIPVLFI